MSKVYQATISTLDKFVPSQIRPLWEHPAGPKTVFFWAPLFKWGVVLAGLNDFVSRPLEKVSLSQTAVLATTGVIWSRYALIIIPKNRLFFAVNLFLALTQGVQFARAFQSQGLVLAGLSDLINRPPELVSIKQSTTLAITGAIWSRYSLVIIPKNMNLFSVNLFVVFTQGIQLIRAIRYQMLNKKEE